ncbi:energy-coupling factor transporter ATPase [Tenuibacillus multivorans]|uniref:Energy-coupling factor transporter ATP-binding protein EcfA2 n=1 Tax=Tenuibacillus multivorans TaxID=237069 RepID=A0A1H0F7S7_9BACI|nr:energy-coupling factor transporter ATPase [Tenuibacillus multivorans]GEL78038.1 energy-coupling factor transporter ATP-binding protein EcfA2 [Tenuibacillus multivorans]SDN90728.1 energy-coupling factor transport system ATP-binding protein [Tenuibacillus multivorans]
MDITFKDVTYTYQPNTPFEHLALNQLNFQIPKGSFTAIVGHTGSGKSTLIQHLNGLLRPSEGTVSIGGFELTNEKNKQIKALRKKVGMVFQYPEHQLFEETVKKDILFGPKNFDVAVSDDQLLKVIDMVGLEPEILERSPFDLSGGQKRRVAIASILILEPELLVLDEPTAGLDPLGQKQMMELFSQLHRKQDITVVLVTHQMEDVLAYANQMLVLENGRVSLKGKPIQVFQYKDYLRQIGLDIPEVIEFLEYLEKETGLAIPYRGQALTELGTSIAKWVKDGDA